MDNPELVRHRLISSVISTICQTSGFDEVESFALETLTELHKSCKIKCFKFFNVLVRLLI